MIWKCLWRVVNRDPGRILGLSNGRGSNIESYASAWAGSGAATTRADAATTRADATNGGDAAATRTDADVTRTDDSYHVSRATGGAAIPDAPGADDVVCAASGQSSRAGA